MLKQKNKTINKPLKENDLEKIKNDQYEYLKPIREIEEKTLSEIELKKDGVHQKAIEYLKITKNICYECGKKISGLGIFECSYCHKYFDIEHHLPEKHHCNGKPPAPEKRIRICYNYKRYYLYRNL